MTEREGHAGPTQQFTEVCLACGENVYATAGCPTRQEPNVTEIERLARLVAAHEYRIARLESERAHTPSQAPSQPQRVVCPICNGTWHCSCF